MSAIEIESLRKSYGDVTAIADLSVSIDDGEFFELLGPNGREFSPRRNHR